MIVISYSIHFICNIGKHYAYILCMYRKRLHLLSRMVWSTRNRHFCRNSWIIYCVRVPKCFLELADIDGSAFKQQSSYKKSFQKSFITRCNGFHNKLIGSRRMFVDLNLIHQPDDTLLDTNPEFIKFRF